jgi:transcriptional regulator with XRE-family HTH domain
VTKTISSRVVVRDRVVIDARTSHAITPYCDNVSVIIASMKAGAVLRNARRRAGLTQRELARVAGVPQPAVSRIERDHVSPRFETLDVLLRGCGLALDLVERPGLGVDRTSIRERLRLSPIERARLTAREWNRTRGLRRRGDDL